MCSNIEEQWKKDIADYGDNAYQMWEQLIDCFIADTKNNAECEYLLNDFPNYIYRKK